MAEASIHFLLESIGHADAQYQQQKHYCMASVEALVKLLELPGKASPSPRARGKKRTKKQLAGKENCFVPDVSVSKPKIVEPKQQSLEPKEQTSLAPQQEEQEVRPQFYEIKNAETQQKQISHVSQHDENEPDRWEVSEFLKTHEEPAGPDCLETHENYRSGELTGPDFSGFEFRREEQETGAELQEEKFLYSLQTNVEKEAAVGIRHSLQIDEEHPCTKEEGLPVEPEILHWEQKTGLESQHEKQYECLHEEQEPGPELHQGDEQDEYLDEPGHEEQEALGRLQTHEEQKSSEEKIPVFRLHQHDEIEPGSDLQFDQYEEKHQKLEAALDLRHSLQSYEVQEVALEFRRDSLQAHDEQLPGKASLSPQARGKKKAKKQLAGKENSVLSVSKTKIVEPNERSPEPKEQPCPAPLQEEQEVRPQFYEIKSAETQQKQILHVSQHDENEPGGGEVLEFLQTHEEQDAGPHCLEPHEKYRSGELTGPESSGFEFRREEQETGAELQDEKFLYSLQTNVEKEAAVGIRHSLQIDEEQPCTKEEGLEPEILHWEQETGLESQHEKQCEFLHEEQEPVPELHQGDEQDEFLDEPGHEEQKGSEENFRLHDEIEPGSEFDQYEDQHQKQEAALDLRHSYEEQEVALEFRRDSLQAIDEQPLANLHDEPGSENLKLYQHEEVDEEQKQYDEQEPRLKVLSSRQAREEEAMRSLSAKRKQELVAGSFQSAQHEEEEPGYQLKHEKQHPGIHFLEQQDARVEFLHSLKTHEEQPCPELQREPGLEFLKFRECEEQTSSLKVTHPFKTQSLCEKPCLELPTAIDRELLQDIASVPQSLKRGPNEGCWRPLQPCREVSLGSLQPESTNTEHSLKSSNLVASMRSFLPLVVQQQPAVPYANGKKDVRVKALEAAEGARKQEEKRAEERKLRKMELLKRDKCNDAAGVTARSKRPLGLRSKIEQEKSKKLEEEQRRKDEEWKKKEMELNAKKRKKEEVEKKEREDKRRKVGDMLRQKKEQEERLRAELDDKEQRRKALEEAERERKATEEDMKRQRRLEKEREIERRRKAEEDAKTSWLAAKEADRKRREETFQRMKMLEKEQRRHVEKNLSTSDMVTGKQQDFYEMQREQSVGLLGHAMRVPRTQAESRVVRGVSEAASFAATSQLPARGTVSMSYAKSSMGLEGGTERYVGTPAVKSSVDPRKPYFSLLGSDLDEDDGPTSYEISPYRSSSDEEDEEEERPQKPVPRWARKENLMPLLMRQAHVDPDEIFTGAKSCSLNQVFGTTGNKKRRDFTQRSDSGDWLVDMVTWKEELQYKKSMGFLHPGPH